MALKPLTDEQIRKIEEVTRLIAELKKSKSKKKAAENNEINP